MTADEVIELRKLWERFNYAPLLPAATVLAEHDWLAYVGAMTEAVPGGENLTFPEEHEVAWAWPDGVALILAEPIEVKHAIISEETPGVWGPTTVPVEAHYETQLCRGVLVGASRLFPSRTADGDELPVDVLAHPVIWIGNDPSDIISGSWIPGTMMHASKTGEISHSSRLLLSLVTALGHRLTRVEEPGGPRAERRRLQRELPEGLRVLQLSSGASVRSQVNGGEGVEWSHRWMVRGHWHTVAHGPKKSLRRLQWYDPYVKGPEDKPLVVRDTVWKTG